jgi:hypothetical protein
MEAVMRIFLLSLAAIGAATIAGAAPAQTTSMTTGHRGGIHAPPAGGTGDFFRSQRGFRRGLHGGPHRHRGRSGRDRLPPFYFGLGGYGEPTERSGDGYFGGGGEVRMEGARPVYDYDRSYPYEWDSAAAPAWGWAEDEAGAAPPRCAFERGVRVCRGGR